MTTEILREVGEKSKCVYPAQKYIYVKKKIIQIYYISLWFQMFYVLVLNLDQHIKYYKHYFRL